MKKLWILGLASALLVLSSAGARASVIVDNWSTAPQGTLQRLSGLDTYTTGTDFSNLLVTVAGNQTNANPFPFGPDGLQTPAITNTLFSGGTTGSSLSTVALFKPTGTSLTFTMNFFGFKQGVKDVSFTLFDVDANKHGSVNVPEVVSFQTAGLTLTGSADNMVSGNKVTGISASNNTGAGSGNANVTVKSGNMPLHEIVFTFSTLPAGIDALAGFSIGNISFTPVPEVGQLAIGLIACLIGGLWLRKNRRQRASSIA
jgi:hypothetical protein